MRNKATLLGLLATLSVAGPAHAQVDTVRGKVGDTLRAPFVSNVPGCWQLQRLTATRGIIERRVGCWDTVPRPVVPPPPRDTTPATQPPPAVALIFSSDFGTALGTSRAAISDGGKWNLIGGEGQEVVSSAGLNFPTPNVLKINALVRNFGFALNRKTGLPVPTPPFKRYYRWYYRHAKPFAPHPDQHPVQDGNSFSDVNWSLNTNQISDATWRPSHEGGAGKRYSIAGVLQTNHTYRFELMIDALTSTTYRLHIKVFNEAGVQVLGDADYFESIVTNVNAKLSLNPILQFNRIANLDGLNAGCNGIHNMTRDLVHSYQGGFAVSDSGWIGPYKP